MSVQGFFILFLSAVSCHAAPKPTNDYCQRPGSIKEAQLQGKWNEETYPPGTVANFDCLPGYTQDGLIKMACIEGTWWQIANGQCKAFCNRPPTDPNSTLVGEVKERYYTGEKVTYVCNVGYTLNRALRGEAQCENTQWINLPVCRRIGEQCGSPPTVLFGDIINSPKKSYQSGQFVEYKCPNYYLHKGDKIVRCLNGFWGEAPVCLEPCTAKQRSMEENNIQLKWHGDTRKLYSPHGDSVEFSCKSGYEVPPNTMMRASCEHGKLEYPKCFRRGFCVLQQSTMITNNIHYNVSTVVDQGQTITFQCNEGMMPENKMEAKCESGKINYPQCIAAKNCKSPEILNGFFKTEPQASYDSGTSVEFECNKDYVKKSLISLKCENGQWTDQPVCYSPCKISLEVLTELHIQLHSSDTDKSYIHGTALEVSCKSGYRRPSQPIFFIECYNGKFRHPRCFSGKTCRIGQDELDSNNLELDEVHENEVFYSEGEAIQFQCKNGFRFLGQSTGTCSQQTLIYPTCTATSCEPPPTVANSRINGGIKDNYASGEKVTFSCNIGYSLERSSTGEGQCENTQWINLPVCRKIGEQCGPPPTVQFGDSVDVRKINYKSGEFVEYRCRNYYVLKGNKVVRCLNGVWDEAPVCLEPCSVKEKKMDENNLALKWIERKKLYSAHGSMIEFLCKSGYEAPPNTQMRIICEDGKLEYPKCFKGVRKMNNSGEGPVMMPCRCDSYGWSYEQLASEMFSFAGRAGEVLVTDRELNNHHDINHCIACVNSSSKIKKKDDYKRKANVIYV
ncbi:complement factor H-related protein 5-like isoform X2 [Phyllobates terribilis]|uniref:complement factor H-related protein 5-like isoform X2 n=1 Tax=Phyllobates terribilis TaxID=111132 RepID=UPI003CCAA3B0